jgi:ferritin-like metal-binding protein YciE
MNRAKFEELLIEALQTEMGGVSVYQTAVECAQQTELKEEWEKYLDQTKTHVELLQDAFMKIGLDPRKETPGRKIVRHIGDSLVKAMKMALEAGDGDAAQVVAAECVVHAETKDHLNWELIGEAVEKLTGDEKKIFGDILEEVEEQEDEHLYHTQGWTRELWIHGLGLPAVIPPPEEEKDVKTAIGAARAKQSRRQMLRGKKKGSHST